METMIEKLREAMDNLLSEVNGRAEEMKENFSSFREVFGKELEVQTENLKGYRNRLETKGRKAVNLDGIVADVREEIEFALNDMKSNFDRFMDRLKERVHQAK